MASLLDLPLELLRIILALCDKPSYRSLSAVCKALHGLANQFLYSHIDWVVSSNRRIDHLLRTFLEQPELAAFPKHIRLAVHDQYASDHGFQWMQEHLEDVDPLDLDTQLIDLAMSQVDELDLPNPNLWWCEALKKGKVDAVVALVLAQLTSLEVLEMSTHLLHKSVFVGTMFRHLQQHRPGRFFRHLRQARLGERCQGFEANALETNMDQIIPLFTLPAIETIHLTVNAHEFNEWRGLKDSVLPSGSMSLTTLRLWNCDLEPDHVSDLLRLSRALRVLNCGLLRDDRDFGPADKIDFADLHSALSLTADTFEELTVTYTMCDKKVDYISPLKLFGKLPGGSLKHFKLLSRLELPAEYLLGDISGDSRLSDMLPRTLRSLTLVNMAMGWDSREEDQNVWLNYPLMQGLINALSEYLHDSARNAPFLEHLILTLGASLRGPSPLDLDFKHMYHPSQPQLLRAIAETSGVELFVRYSRRAPGKSWSVGMHVYNPSNPSAEIHEYPPTSALLDRRAL